MYISTGIGREYTSSHHKHLSPHIHSHDEALRPLQVTLLSLLLAKLCNSVFTFVSGSLVILYHYFLLWFILGYVFCYKIIYLHHDSWKKNDSLFHNSYYCYILVNTYTISMVSISLTNPQDHTYTLVIILCMIITYAAVFTFLGRNWVVLNDRAPLLRFTGGGRGFYFRRSCS